jgi:hypothetical protein
MITQFRKLSAVNLFFLVVVSIALRLGVFLQLPEKLSFNFMEPFAWMMINMPTQAIFSPLENVTIAAALTLLQAMILNRIINNHNILGKPTFLPALMYVTCSSILTPFLVLNPVIFCNFFILWMISKFFGIYHKNEARSVMFDLGMIVAAGTLIYFPFIAMMPLLWISLVIFRPFNWREWIAILLGFITIYFFLAVFFYMNDSLDKFYQIWLPLTNHFPTNIHINIYDYIVLFPVVIIFVLSAVSLQQNFFRSFVHVRKSFQVLFFMFLLGILSFYLKPQVDIYHFLLALAPAAIFMAYYFLNARVRWFYESLYAILAAFIIYFQFL